MYNLLSGKWALFPKKRSPRPGQLKILSKEEERIIVKIHRRLNANELNKPEHWRE